MPCNAKWEAGETPARLRRRNGRRIIHVHYVQPLTHFLVGRGLGKADEEDDAEVGTPAVIHTFISGTAASLRITASKRSITMRFAALVLLALSAGTTLAQQVVTTRPIVASLIPQGGVVHVLTQLNDVDYDGQLDSGEVTAQWQIIDRTTLNVISTKTFPWGMTTANRTAIDSLTGLMFISISDTLWAYTTLTQQRSATPVFVGLCYAVAYDAPTGKLYISQRPSFDQPGRVVIKDVTTQQETSVTTGINPQQTVVYRDALGKATAVVLCDGLFGQPNGKLVFIEENGDTSSLTLGDTPNHMAMDEAHNLLYVVMNGEHAVKVVNLSTREVTATWPTNTTGYDGPREISLDDRWAFVTTYSGKLLTFDRTTGTINNSIDLTAKADPVLAIDNAVWVGLSYKLGEYAATGNVTIYPMSTVGVQEQHVPMIQPLGNVMLMPTFSIGAPITVRTLNGADVEVSYDAEQRILNTHSLVSGTYVASDGVHSTLIQVAQ